MRPEQREAVDTALFAYWTSRRDAAAAQLAKGNPDVGGRAEVTSGGHMNRIAQLLGQKALEAGAPLGAVFYQAPGDDPNKREKIAHRYTLPGYYRPTKSWDLVVYAPDGLPCVAVELKSQNGPSYGNNANNRAEEALGNAVDLKRAMEMGLVKGDPWVGYVFLIEDDVVSRALGGKRESAAFARDPIFNDWTYLDRVRLLSQRLVEDGYYSSAWAVATSRPTCGGKSSCPVQIRQKAMDEKAEENGLPTPERLPDEHVYDWTELDPATSGFEQFIAAMTQRIKTHYPNGPSAPEVGQLSLPDC